MEISCSGEPKKCPASSHRLGAPGGSLAGCRAAAAAAADAFTFLSGRTHAHSERTPRPGFPRRSPPRRLQAACKHAGLPERGDRYWRSRAWPPLRQALELSVTCTV